jgi:succinoglycan biosynthesis protein ExoA
VGPWPYVTIAMPCLDEEAYIEASVRSALAQDYPADRIEMVVADGGSTDRTLAILERLAASDPRVRVVPNPGRIQATGMNEAIRAAQGDVVVRMDAHCEYAPDYVRSCVDVLRRTGADNVGGAQRLRAKTRFQGALCAALSSPAGVGGARYRSTEKEGDVDTVFLGAFDRSVFERVGLYDPGAVTNEDAELNQRILERGGRVYLSRSIVVHYFPRGDFRSLARQYHAYGQGRARTLCKHRAVPSLRPLVPFAFVVAAAALLILPDLRPLAPWLLGAYLAITGAEALRVGREEGPFAVPLVWAMFPVMHVSHGTGFARGLCRYLLTPDWRRSPERLSHPPHAAAGEATSSP